MHQNTKRTPLPGSRWMYLLDFLRSDHAAVKSLLQAGITPWMIRAKVWLESGR